MPKSERIGPAEVIEQLKEEKNKAVLQASEELARTILTYNTKIVALGEVSNIRQEGKELTPQQYERVAKLLCPGYWCDSSKEKNPTKTVCYNCGPGGIEDCMTRGDRTIAGRLVL